MYPRLADIDGCVVDVEQHGQATTTWRSRGPCGGSAIKMNSELHVKRVALEKEYCSRMQSAMHHMGLFLVFRCVSLLEIQPREFPNQRADSTTLFVSSGPGCFKIRFGTWIVVRAANQNPGAACICSGLDGH